MSAARARAARLVLFDIDGTLLSGGRAARTVFAAALTEVFGTCGDVETFAFEGKLDPVIVKELLLAAGVPEETVLRRRGDALALYLDRLEAALAVERPRPQARGGGGPGWRRPRGRDGRRCPRS